MDVSEQVFHLPYKQHTDSRRGWPRVEGIQKVDNQNQRQAVFVPRKALALGSHTSSQRQRTNAVVPSCLLAALKTSYQDTITFIFINASDAYTTLHSIPGLLSQSGKTRRYFGWKSLACPVPSFVESKWSTLIGVHQRLIKMTN